MSQLRFAVPSIDELIGREIASYPAADEPRVVCILGPDGVGKSILALHLASAFWLDARTDRATPAGAAPAVFYVSTDLKAKQAAKTWHDFGLNFPAQRERAVRSATGAPTGRRGSGGEVRLTEVSPQRQAELAPADQAKPLEVMLDRRAWTNQVFFLDLASHSAGDDWTLINRLVGFLADFPADLRHLLVVDAVEGLQALVGEHDPFGQQRTRRSRIAQLIRMAKCANCHLVLIIEEGRPEERLPEEFMADLVVRVRAGEEDGYNRRTIEIEKARGVSHVRWDPLESTCRHASLSIL